jgi:hypothetical protein
MTLTAERLKSRLVGTSLGGLLQAMQRTRHRRSVARDPKLDFVSREADHLDAALATCLKPTDNCVDVGCHLGSMLSDLCRLAPRGKTGGGPPHAAQGGVASQEVSAGGGDRGGGLGRTG